MIKPSHDDHAFNAITDITEVMHKVSENFLPESKRLEFDNETTGFPQRLNRAANKRSLQEITKVIDDWNTAIVRLCETGIIPHVIDECKSLNPTLVERILNQTYSRTVSPNLKLLHKYEAGTDNVYGELLPSFVSKILKQDVTMTSEQLFVDLGSGVGNVVLQAALEIGCESWGCEMMEQYCDVADMQHGEFLARCRLWGLALGKIELERGNFLTNPNIAKVLKRADVILVNNQVFTPQLNEGLTNLFLDLKDGCQVVSLKSFVPNGHKISARNVNSPYNVLDVKRKEYYSNSVSWTNQGGQYFVSTKDSTRVKKHLKIGKSGGL